MQLSLSQSENQGHGITESAHRQQQLDFGALQAKGAMPGWGARIVYKSRWLAALAALPIY